MTQKQDAEFQKLVDGYLAGELDAAALALLERRLREDESLRTHFVEYTALDTELRLQLRQERALAQSLRQLDRSSPDLSQFPADSPIAELPRRKESWREGRRLLSPTQRRVGWLVVATLLLLLTSGWWYRATLGSSGSAVAWIVNAQNCDWNRQTSDRGQFVAGQTIRIERGLLELGFDSQASALIEGPAELQVVSGKRVILEQGRLSVKMPTGLSGFEVLTPHGRILDLGTEFGVFVSAAGEVDVAVFDGEVLAFAGDDSVGQKLKQDQAARWAADRLELRPVVNASFVREIVPPPVRVPKFWHVDFAAADADVDSAVPNRAGVNSAELNNIGVNGTEVKHSVLDRQGQSIGLRRLAGTGSKLPDHDTNIELDASAGLLRVTATRSDINHQGGLDVGEFLGVALSDLGFTGEQDFEVRMQVLNTPSLEGYGQYGVYVADDTRHCIRGGVIRWTHPQQYTQFLVNTRDGVDQDANQLGYISPGSDIEVILRRLAGKYSLEVRDLKNENSNTLQIRHPSFLDAARDLQVGLFVSNPFHDVHATVTFDSFKVTVWHEQRISE